MSANSNQYVSIQGWMGKSGLSLSGPSLIIYAIIYGFSQDGATACRCHLTYFEEWADVCERTARAIISDLAAAGYIFRVALGEGRGALVEYRANLEIAAAAQKGAKFAPINKGAKFSEKGAKSCKKGGKIFQQDNNIIIYNNIFFFTACAREGAPLEEGRKEEIYKLFYFKNAAAPAAELEEFYRINTLNDWQDGQGRKMDASLSKLLAWADGWTLKKGAGRVNEAFLAAWREIYNEAVRLSDPAAAALLNISIKCISDKTTVVLYAPQRICEWLEAKVMARDNRVSDIWHGFVHGRKMMYQLIVG